VCRTFAYVLRAAVVDSQPVGDAGGETGESGAMDGDPGGVTRAGALMAAGGVGAHPRRPPELQTRQAPPAPS